MTRKRDNRRSVMFDVKYPSHRRIRHLRVKAKWLSVVGQCWSGKHLTGGEIDPVEVLALAEVTKQYMAELIKHDVWHKSGHACPNCPQPKNSAHVVIHGYLGTRMGLGARREAIPQAVRDLVFVRDNHKCLGCGSRTDLTLDHIYPWSLGGSDEPENLRVLCRPCNSRKGAKVNALVQS